MIKWFILALLNMPIALAGPPEPLRQFLEMEGQRNLLSNPGFENGKQDWNLVSPASTFTILNNSTVVGLGSRSFAFLSKGANEHLDSDLFVIPGALASKACIAKIGYNWSTGTAGQMYLEVYNHAAVKIASTVLMPQNGWGQRTVNFNCPAAGSLKMRLATAPDKGVPPALHLDSMWLGSDYSTVSVASAFAYWSGAVQGGASACQFPYTTTTFADPGTDSDCAISEITNVNMGTVALRTSAGAGLPGIIITPQSTGYYSVCATINFDGTVGQQHVVRLKDTTSGVVLHFTGGANDASGSQSFMTMCGVDNFSNLSPRTITIEAATSSGTLTMVQRTVNGQYAPTVQWTIFKVN